MRICRWTTAEPRAAATFASGGSATGGTTASSISAGVPETKAAARGLARSACASGATALPGDRWIAGQRVRYLVEDERAQDAVNAAQRMPRGSQVVRGTRRVTRFSGADFAARRQRVQRRTRRHADEGERCRWTDISCCSRATRASDTSGCACADRGAFEARFWALSRPLFLLAGERSSDGALRAPNDGRADPDVALSAQHGVGRRRAGTARALRVGNGLVRGRPAQSNATTCTSSDTNRRPRSTSSRRPRRSQRRTLPTRPTGRCTTRSAQSRYAPRYARSDRRSRPPGRILPTWRLRARGGRVRCPPQNRVRSRFDRRGARVAPATDAGFGASSTIDSSARAACSSTPAPVAPAHRQRRSARLRGAPRVARASGRSSASFDRTRDDLGPPAVRQSDGPSATLEEADSARTRFAPSRTRDAGWRVLGDVRRERRRRDARVPTHRQRESASWYRRAAEKLRCGGAPCARAHAVGRAVCAAGRDAVASASGRLLDDARGPVPDRADARSREPTMASASRMVEVK